MEPELDIPEEKIMVKADRIQMLRAINNLLTNTIRHNPEGTAVTVIVKKDNRNAVLQISDMGVRIERDVAIHLFEPFVQADKSRTSGKGSGLGLSISAKTVEMHGGKIRLIQYNNVEKSGRVKCFEIVLPVIL